MKRGSHSNYKLSVIYKKLKYFTPLILLLQKLHLQVTAKKQNLKKICRIVQKVIRKGLSTSLTDVTWISFCLFIKAFTSENKEKSQCAFYVRSVQVLLGQQDCLLWLIFRASCLNQSFRTTSINILHCEKNLPSENIKAAYNYYYYSALAEPAQLKLVPVNLSCCFLKYSKLTERYYSCDDPQRIRILLSCFLESK